MMLQEDYIVTLSTRSFWQLRLKASSSDDAKEQAWDIWHRECPHPFENFGDDELIDVRARKAEASEVQS